MKVFYDPVYVARASAFDTTRKAADVAKLCADHPDLEIIAPRRASWRQIRLAHSARYLTALRSGRPRNLAQTDGFAWSPDTWRSLTASAGGVIDAARAALDEGAAVSLSSGLHHARRGRGAGFCAINGLAVAALAIDRTWQLPGPVLVLDLDAHGSGGTQSIVAGCAGVSIADVVTHGFDPTQATSRCQRRTVHAAEAYLQTVELALEWAAEQRPALVLYNAGVDIHERNDLGGLARINTRTVAAREAMVAQWAKRHGLPICGVLAGGYCSPTLPASELAALHMLMVEALADNSH